MFTYETLDAIADAYNPTLFIVFIVFSFIYYKQSGWLVVFKGFLGILICYLVMFADNTLKLWHTLSLDYSTHSSVAFSLVYFLIHRCTIKSSVSLSFVTSLICYYLLVIYQQYHTIQDIISTLIIVVPLIFYAYRGVDLLR
ncbi:hypothetical protein AB835_08505 [Candidatus Endobugula sertula]|uniref:Phosphatidic acid phosphatase type 2/haloperoxidase domain-containing protein n=1 Tax=Candidatus Endobugula sertula TaxID=62101 RepID=A0A1D2QPL4_9GAMM|nr:hypothetical protein AB835_08505 [Candidatus Endobugula sertula]